VNLGAGIRNRSVGIDRLGEYVADGVDCIKIMSTGFGKQPSLSVGLDDDRCSDLGQAAGGRVGAERGSRSSSSLLNSLYFRSINKVLAHRYYAWCLLTLLVKWRPGNFGEARRVGVDLVSGNARCVAGNRDIEVCSAACRARSATAAGGAGATCASATPARTAAAGLCPAGGRIIACS
jgi:hypothetical protein